MTYTFLPQSDQVSQLTYLFVSYLCVEIAVLSVPLRTHPEEVNLLAKQTVLTAVAPVREVVAGTSSMASAGTQSRCRRTSSVSSQPTGGVVQQHGGRSGGPCGDGHLDGVDVDRHAADADSHVTVT